MERVRQVNGSRLSAWTYRHRIGIRRAVRYTGLTLVLVVFMQLAYPHDRALPGVNASGVRVGGSSTTDIQKKLDAAYDKAAVTVKTADKTVSASYDEIGVSVDSKATAKKAVDYSFGKRLIPFSSLSVRGKDIRAIMQYDDDRLTYFAQQTSKKTYVAPVNATIAVRSSTVELVPSKPSKSYDATAIAQAIKSADHQPHTIVTMRPVVKEAPRSDSEVKSVLKQAQTAVDTQLTLAFNNEQKAITKADIASWLEFVEDPTTKQLQLSLKTDVVKKYLDGIQGKIYKAPGTTTINTVDNVEVSRTTGADGVGLDADKAVALMNDALKAGKSTTISVPIVALPAKVTYSRQYTKTSAGLAALLQTLSASNGFGISVVDPNGTMSGSVNGGKRFEAASTYKLFVAYAVFQQINSGAMHWSDTINGQPADACFDAMIIKSDNPCALAFGNQIGWGNIDNMIHAIGFNGTVVSGSTKYTNANDLASFLQRLQAGSLLNSADQGRLLNAMQRQIYRSGIPAGTGLTVADKVGFVDDVIHDAGIVYGPHGPYVLVVMTSNSSWGTIADIASQINTLLN